MKKVKGSGQTRHRVMERSKSREVGQELEPGASGEKPAGGAEGTGSTDCRNQPLRSKPGLPGACAFIMPSPSSDLS